MVTRLALKDDKTTTGGCILGPSSDWYNEDGRAFALAEDLATCGNCKGSWPVGGMAHDVMHKGRSFVKDLAPVYCPCGKNRVFASGSSPFFYSENDEPTSTQSSVASTAYDQQFVLRDGAGKPLANTYYTIASASGDMSHGETDSQGLTERYTPTGRRRQKSISGTGGNREHPLCNCRRRSAYQRRQ